MIKLRCDLCGEEVTVLLQQRWAYLTSEITPKGKAPDSQDLCMGCYEGVRRYFKGIREAQYLEAREQDRT